MKMYLLLKNDDLPASHVSLLEGSFSTEVKAGCKTELRVDHLIERKRWGRIGWKEGRRFMISNEKHDSQKGTGETCPFNDSWRHSGPSPSESIFSITSFRCFRQNFPLA